MSVVFDGTNVIIYVNGVSKGTDTIGAPTSSPSNIFTIGNRSTSDRAFDGFIDEVRIYNRALTTAEITDLYNQGR